MTLASEHARLSTWLTANVSRVGTLEFRKATLTHRVLTDLMKSDTPAMRAAVAVRLAEIERAGPELMSK